MTNLRRSSYDNLHVANDQGQQVGRPHSISTCKLKAKANTNANARANTNAKATANSNAKARAADKSVRATLNHLSWARAAHRPKARLLGLAWALVRGALRLWVRAATTAGRSAFCVR